ncbi:MAG: hypothetical protein AAGF07_04130 [Patescibacteria group bacterium]
MDHHLAELIAKTPFLSPGDKSFLAEKIKQMNALDKLKLQQSLTHGKPPDILQSLQLIRAKFFESEKPKEPDLITKFTSAILPKKPPKVVSQSILTQPQILGTQPPQAVTGENIRNLAVLSEFYHPAQLSMLASRHVTFGLNDNDDQIIISFLKNLDKVFDKITNVNVRRGYFMNFVQSPLFGSYINTGLTALRHPELQPANIILNLLYQINPNYLNNKQFTQASVICNHLKGLCGI